MEKFLEIGEQWSELSKKLRKESEKYLKKVLQKADGKRINLDWEELEELDLNEISVSYDGGNHPEYASDCFATVEGVHITKNGKLCVEVEEEYDYEVDRITTSELYDVAFLVSEYLEAKEE